MRHVHSLWLLLALTGCFPFDETYARLFADGGVADGGAVSDGPSRRTLAVNSAFSCAVHQADGTVRCWGDATRGLLGPVDAGRTASPTDIPELSGVTQLAAGLTTACARASDGGAWCWGSNNLGAVGNGLDSGVTTTPFRLAGEVRAVAAGSFHGCALAADGGVRCWGSNVFGQLSSSGGPIAVPPARALSSSGSHACTLHDAGALWCWGYNEEGELGVGDLVSPREPLEVLGADVLEVSAGFSHTCARLAGGTVRCWGDNRRGALGFDGGALWPTEVPGLTDVTQLSAGNGFTCARRADAGVLCWGENNDGQLGDGTRVSRATPAPVAGLGPAQEVAAGAQHTCARLTSGEVWCWGSNEAGQLGNPDVDAGSYTARSLVPVLVLGD